MAEHQTTVATVCEPPPEHACKRWHWIDVVDHHDGKHSAIVAGWVGGKWKRIGKSAPFPPDIAWQHGWRYLEPCVRAKSATCEQN